MSLNVYLREEDIPKGMELIDNNDFTFAYDVTHGLIITKELSNLMQLIDHATSVPERDEMIGRFGKRTSILNLSTSTKTVINAVRHPNACISSIECGNNVLAYLLRLTKGNILLYYLPSLINMPVDIVLHYANMSQHFTDLSTFALYAEKLLKEG